MTEVVPLDAQFEEDFGRATVSKSNIARYYLRSLELFGKEKFPQLLINEDPNAVNLEHVLPRNPSADWKIDKEIAATVFKRIGNMVLLGAKDNVTLGNGSFASKRPTLLASPFTTTKEVGKNTGWDGELIRKRQLALAKIVPKVWPL